MKFIVIAATLCLATTEAVKVQDIFNDQDTASLVEKLGHQGADSDDSVAEALEEQVAIREHQQEEKKKREKYMKRLHRNDNWRDEMKKEAQSKAEE